MGGACKNILSTTGKNIYGNPSSTSVPTFGKQLPTKKMVTQRKVNLEVLKKLILLNNNYVQYHVIPYDETIMEANGENIIYYQPNTDNIINHDILNPDNILELNRFILLCCNNKSISKKDMMAANKMWYELQAEARNAQV